MRVGADEYGELGSRDSYIKDDDRLERLAECMAGCICSI